MTTALEHRWIVAHTPNGGVLHCGDCGHVPNGLRGDETTCRKSEIQRLRDEVEHWKAVAGKFQSLAEQAIENAEQIKALNQKVMPPAQPPRPLPWYKKIFA
jgi:hypothetical protein